MELVGLLTFARGLEVVLPKGCVELETGFLVELLVRLNGVEMVRLLVVVLVAEDVLAVELGLLESSPCEVESLELELGLSVELA